MANFSKLNIGDRVASSGLRRFRKLSVEQLPSPYGVSLDGDYLTWGDYSILATSFDILVDGVVKATVSAPTNSFDLSTLGLADGTYSITVVSKASGYANSDPSEAVTYTVGGDGLAGTWVLNNDLSYANGVNSISDIPVEGRYFGVNPAGQISEMDITTVTLYPEGVTYMFSIRGDETYYDDIIEENMHVYNYYYGESVKCSYSAISNKTYTSNDSEFLQLKTFTITSENISHQYVDIFKAWLKANATKQ